MHKRVSKKKSRRTKHRKSKKLAYDFFTGERGDGRFSDPTISSRNRFRSRYEGHFMDPTISSRNRSRHFESGDGHFMDSTVSSRNRSRNRFDGGDNLLEYYNNLQGRKRTTRRKGHHTRKTRRTTLKFKGLEHYRRLSKRKSKTPRSTRRSKRRRSKKVRL